MNNIKNILVPVDFSGESEAALKAANKLAIKLKAKVHVVNFSAFRPVVTPIYSGDSTSVLNSALHERQLEVETSQMLDQLRMKMERCLSPGLRSDLYIVRESMKQGIEDVLKENDIDLIVSGTVDEDGLLAQLTTSNTEKLIRNAGIPVLAVTEKEELLLDHILVATDLSTDLPNRLYGVCSILERMGAQIHIVNVNTTELLNEADILAKMSVLVQYLDLKNYKLHVVPDRKEINGILKLIKQINPGLILMKTYEKSAFWALFQGSLAEKVIRKTDVPVLVEQV